jgi:hypothetical protein
VGVLDGVGVLDLVGVLDGVGVVDFVGVLDGVGLLDFVGVLEAVAECEARGAGGFGPRISTAAMLNRSPVGDLTPSVTRPGLATLCTPVCTQYVFPPGARYWATSLCPDARCRPALRSQSLPTAATIELTRVVLRETAAVPLPLLVFLAPMPDAPVNPSTVICAGNAPDARTART